MQELVIGYVPSAAQNRWRRMQVLATAWNVEDVGSGGADASWRRRAAMRWERKRGPLSGGRASRVNNAAPNAPLPLHHRGLVMAAHREPGWRKV